MEAKASSVGAKTVNEPNLKYIYPFNYLSKRIYIIITQNVILFIYLPGPDSVSASPAFVTRSNNVDNSAFFFKTAGMLSWQLWSWNSKN
jgi:hypothetical protein